MGKFIFEKSRKFLELEFLTIDANLFKYLHCTFDDIVRQLLLYDLFIEEIFDIGDFLIRVALQLDHDAYRSQEIRRPLVLSYLFIQFLFV